MAAISTYKKEYCKKVIEHCSKGFSLSSFAAEIDIQYSTMKQWQNNFPEFKEACTLAKQKRKKDHEAIGIDLAKGNKQGSATAWIFMQKAYFGRSDQPKNVSTDLVAAVDKLDIYQLENLAQMISSKLSSFNDELPDEHK